MLFGVLRGSILVLGHMGCKVRSGFTFGIIREFDGFVMITRDTSKNIRSSPARSSSTRRKELLATLKPTNAPELWT